MLVAKTVEVERLVERKNSSREIVRKNEFNEEKQILREQLHSQKERLAGEKQTALDEPEINTSLKKKSSEKNLMKRKKNVLELK